MQRRREAQRNAKRCRETKRWRQKNPGQGNLRKTTESSAADEKINARDFGRYCQERGPIIVVTCLGFLRGEARAAGDNRAVLKLCKLVIALLMLPVCVGAGEALWKVLQ